MYWRTRNGVSSISKRKKKNNYTKYSLPRALLTLRYAYNERNDFFFFGLSSPVPVRHTERPSEFHTRQYLVREEKGKDEDDEMRMRAGNFG